MYKNLTRSNIAHDLTVSPHFLQIKYPEGISLRYIFSSELYKRKFTEKYEENRKAINASLSNRFGFQIDAEMIADIKLYTTIEKRGFLIYRNNEVITCQDKITISGNSLMMKK